MIMNHKIGTQQQGFTLIELLIATTVFSVILLIAAATLIQIGRMYYKGIITSKTQGVARTVTDDISRSIQFSGGNFGEASDGINNAYCIGDTRYTYVLRAQQDSDVEGYSAEDQKIPHALWQDNINSGECSIDLPQLQFDDPYAEAVDRNRNGRALLEDNMQLQFFDVEPQQPGSDVFKVRVMVVYYAAVDLLNNPDGQATCKGSSVGGQWCAISDLSSVVYSRAN